jgi:hypothetical protein
MISWYKVVLSLSAQWGRYDIEHLSGRDHSKAWEDVACEIEVTA